MKKIILILVLSVISTLAFSQKFYVVNQSVTICKSKIVDLNGRTIRKIKKGAEVVVIGYVYNSKQFIVLYNNDKMFIHQWDVVLTPALIDLINAGSMGLPTDAYERLQEMSSQL